MGRRHRYKKAAADKLIWVLANLQGTQQEWKTAQAELDAAKTAWNTFLEAKKVREETFMEGTSTEGKSSQTLAVVSKELPAFQIKGGPIRNASKKMHDTISDRGLHWEQARTHLEKEFGNPFYFWQKKDEHRHLAQCPNESIHLFLERYQEVSYEANLASDQDLVYNFVCSLLPPIKKKAWSTLMNQYGLELTSDLQQATQLIMAACGEGTNNTYSETSSNSKRRYDNEGFNGSKKHKRARQGTCPLHPKGSHAKEECFVWKSMLKEAAAKNNKPHNNGQKGHKEPNLCRYCKKVEYTKGHTCPEYWNSKKVVANRSVKVMDIEDPDNLLPINMEKLDLQQQGANGSFMDLALAQELHLSVNTNKKYNIQLASTNGTTNSFGTVEAKLLYKGKHLKHTFIVMNLSLGTRISIGLDLMPKLGLGITGIAASWDDQMEKNSKDSIINDIFKPNDSPAGTTAKRHVFFQAIQPSLHGNANIPSSSFCTIPESIICLDTPEGLTSYRRQYNLPVVYESKVQEAVDTWLKEGTIERAPVDTAWNSPLTLAPKKDASGNYTDRRPCLDP
ncbi:hypothetical protein EC973_006544 [Apophysomyces ossiformis]|uniref:Uncharacterized protein n=1 Tax=Apophysomyces ossiformis TaxID=679940 RepID=A0A8H7BJM1_9FUNG|nr:hypothetical protein EC973_006544 [Apophysomyces ossiformis]